MADVTAPPLPLAPPPTPLKCCSVLTPLLKKHMVADWEWVHGGAKAKGCVCPRLPLVPSAREVLERWEKDEGGGGLGVGGGKKTACAKREVVERICEYMNQGNANWLLYSGELKGWDAYLVQRRTETPGEEVIPSELLGAEHILRLIVLLPQVIPNLESMSTTKTKTLEAALKGLIKYLSKEYASLFTASPLPAAKVEKKGDFTGAEACEGPDPSPAAKNECEEKNVS